MNGPASIRATPEGYAALKILKQRYPEKSRQQLTSDALVREVDGTRGSPTIVFNMPSPTDLLYYRADLAKSVEHYGGIRKDLFEAVKAPAEGEADKVVATIERIDAHMEFCIDTDKCLLENAKLGNALTKETDVEALRAVRKYAEDSCKSNHHEALRHGFEILSRILPR